MTIYKAQPLTRTTTPRCMSCLQTHGRHLDTCLDFGTVIIPPPEDYVTMTGVIRALDKHPESHRAPSAGIPRVPAWALASVFFGAVLIGVGFLMNQPVAHLVYWMLHQ